MEIYTWCLIKVMTLRFTASVKQMYNILNIIIYSYKSRLTNRNDYMDNLCLQQTQSHQTQRISGGVFYARRPATVNDLYLDAITRVNLSDFTSPVRQESSRSAFGQLFF